MPSTEIPAAPTLDRSHDTVVAVLLALSVSHLFNDTAQSLMTSLYPLLKESYHLTFTQIGLITLVAQSVASLLQPIVGLVADKRPLPSFLAWGMMICLMGIVVLALAGSFPLILLAAALMGVGAAIFHPEAARVARMAAGQRFGFAQSIFQVGGNAGMALGPLLAALIVVPHGQKSLLGFIPVAGLGVFLLHRIGNWYRANLHRLRPRPVAEGTVAPRFSRGKVLGAVGVLLVLIFSKFFYLASMSSYYTFYLIERFGVSVASAQTHLFIFLVAVTAGTLLGGPLGDRFGVKPVIWASILGVAPFSLLLPHVGLWGVTLLSLIIGAVLSSAFSAIIVYAQELVPGKVGMISGLFFGLAFGLGGIGSAVLGKIADHTSILFVFQICAFLPLLGIFTVFLPEVRSHRVARD
jgi:FSR family fosmidomycin resistance protein-like MFS transporter